MTGAARSATAWRRSATTTFASTRCQNQGGNWTTRGGHDDRGPSAGRDAEGGVRAHRGCPPRRVAGRPAQLRRVGDLPPRGCTERSDAPVRVAVDGLVRSGDPAIRRRRVDVAAGGQRLQLRGRDGHPPVVRRHPAPVGVRPRVAPRAVAHRPRHDLRRRGGRRAVQVDRRRGDLDRAVGSAHPLVGSELAAGRRWHVRAHRAHRSHQCRPPARRHLGRRRVPQRRRGSHVGADQPRPAVRGHPRPRRRRRALRPPDRPASLRDPTRCSCRSTGT